jgi:hypothetical protein
MTARWAVGIDLGTSNTVVAAAPLAGGPPVVFPVPQLVQARAIEARELYPSMLFAGTASELAEDPFAESPWITGELARRRGVEVPARLVASAKSWLCHARVDRRAALLPLGADEGTPKISPVDASAALLAHVRRTWDEAHPDAKLAAQDVVLTVPASFDEIARELTLEAAHAAGLAPRLLEEPIAAFYAARENGAFANAPPTARVLVVDVGGGTTDLSLLEARREGDALVGERLAVGRHLLLGGDNMDLALAHAVERRFVAPPARLAPGSFAQLVAACRAAKETLLGDAPPAEVVLRIVEPGAKLVGGVRSAPLRADDVERVLEGGFFPRTHDDAVRARGGFLGFGLPYEADTVIPRHVTRFLARQADPRVDVVLFNGGVFHAHPFRAVIHAAVARAVGRPLEDVAVVATADVDRAVAQGATLHALARHRGGRVIARAARTWYVGAASAGSDAPKAVALVPRGTDEGATVELATPFQLTVGKPVRFDLFTDDRPARAGDVVTVDDEHERLPPLVLAIDGHDLRRAATTIPVRLGATLEDTGTLALHMTEDEGRRHSLRFDLRRETTPSMAPPPPSVTPKLADARAAIEAAFTRGDEKAAKELPDRLESLLGARGGWTGPILRALFDQLAAQPGARKRSRTHERVFFSLAGYTLRPGFGDPGDRARVDLLDRIFPERLAFPDEVRGWQQLFVAYRRIAGGLDEAAQTKLREALDPFVAPPSAGRAKPKKWRPLADGELLDLVAALERVPARTRADLGDWVLELALGKRSPHPWVCLGRIGAREPAYASPHHVVDPVVAERWIEQLLRQKWTELAPAPAIAVRLARMTGDRARDVSVRVRKDVERKLVQAGASEALLRAVREHVPLDAGGRAELFGDALPLGLALDLA